MQVAESGLKLPFERPHLDCLQLAWHCLESMLTADKKHGWALFLVRWIAKHQQHALSLWERDCRCRKVFEARERVKQRDRERDTDIHTKKKKKKKKKKNNEKNDR